MLNVLFRSSIGIGYAHMFYNCTLFTYHLQKRLARDKVLSSLIERMDTKDKWKREMNNEANFIIVDFINVPEAWEHMKYVNDRSGYMGVIPVGEGVRSAFADAREQLLGVKESLYLCVNLLSKIVCIVSFD